MSLRDALLLTLTKYMDVPDLEGLKLADVAVYYDNHWDANETIALPSGHIVTTTDKPDLVHTLEAFLNAEVDGRPFVDYHPGCVPWLFASSRTSRRISRRMMAQHINKITAHLRQPTAA